MATERLELVSIAAIKAMKDVQFHQNQNELIRTYDNMKDAIKAYTSGKFVESAELFISAWRNSENSRDGFFQKEISLYNVPRNLNEALSWGEENAYTLKLLGIYALHDAATAYFEAPKENFHSDNVVFAPSSYQIELEEQPLDTGKNTIENAKQTEFGIVTGGPMKVDGVQREEGVPIRSLFKVKDSLGQVLSGSRENKDAAHSIALFCLRAARFTEIRNTSFHLQKELQEQSLRRIKFNMSLVVTCTVPGTSWIKSAGIPSLEVLEEAKASSSEEDAAWKKRLDVVLTAARSDKLKMLLVEPYF